MTSQRRHQSWRGQTRTPEREARNASPTSDCPYPLSDRMTAASSPGPSSSRGYRRSGQLDRRLGTPQVQRRGELRVPRNDRGVSHGQRHEREQAGVVDETQALLRGDPLRDVEVLTGRLVRLSGRCPRTRDLSCSAVLVAGSNLPSSFTSLRFAAYSALLSSWLLVAYRPAAAGETRCRPGCRTASHPASSPQGGPRIRRPPIAGVVARRIWHRGVGAVIGASADHRLRGRFADDLAARDVLRGRHPAITVSRSAVMNAPATGTRRRVCRAPRVQWRP